MLAWCWVGAAGLLGGRLLLRCTELHNWGLVDGRGVQHGVDGVIIENMHDTPYCLDKDLGKATTMKTVILHSILTSFPWLDFRFFFSTGQVLQSRVSGTIWAEFQLAIRVLKTQLSGYPVYPQFSILIICSTSIFKSYRYYFIPAQLIRYRVPTVFSFFYPRPRDYSLHGGSSPASAGYNTEDHTCWSTDIR